MTALNKWNLSHVTRFLFGRAQGAGQIGLFSSSSRARFPHAETVLEQLVQDPIREFWGSTLGSANFCRW